MLQANGAKCQQNNRIEIRTRRLSLKSTLVRPGSRGGKRLAFSTQVRIEMYWGHGKNHNRRTKISDKNM